MFASTNMFGDGSDTQDVTRSEGSCCLQHPARSGPPIPPTYIPSGHVT